MRIFFQPSKAALQYFWLNSPACRDLADVQTIWHQGMSHPPAEWPLQFYTGLGFFPRTELNP